MIQTTFRAMIMLLLAKFIINDMPHAAGLVGDPHQEPPTPGQLRYIAVLCQQLGIQQPHEEEVRTQGEAGRMIRELEAERDYRKRLKKGNPGKSELDMVPGYTGEPNPVPAPKPGEIWYHGRSGPVQFLPTQPAFFTRDRRDAEWFSYERGEGVPGLTAARLDIRNPARYRDLLAAVDSTGATESDIAEHGPYVGEVETDYLYVPSVVARLRELGFDGYVGWDVLENTSIHIAVPFSVDQITILSTEPLEARRGNPSTLRVERTTVDKIGDDLERAWHRIEGDMSTEMQSSLGILKEVLGHYWLEPVVAVWDGENLVGVAVYETYDDKDLGTRETHIKELASFIHGAGVGKALVDEVTKLSREEGCQYVTASSRPESRGFYEKLGFVRDTRLIPAGEVSTLMMYRLKIGERL